MTKKAIREVRMDSIIAAAIEEFLEKGYEKTSIDAIAIRAGVSKGGVYHHFPNKESVLVEANRKLSEPIEEIAARAYENENAINGLKYFIREYFDYWLQRPKELSFYFFSMSKAYESETLMKMYQDYTKSMTTFYVELFQRAKEQGAQVEDAEASGITLMGAIDGVLTYALMNPEMDIPLLIKRITKIWIKEDKSAPESKEEEATLDNRDNKSVSKLREDKSILEMEN